MTIETGPNGEILIIGEKTKLVIVSLENAYIRADDKPWQEMGEFAIAEELIDAIVVQRGASNG